MIDYQLAKELRDNGWSLPTKECYWGSLGMTDFKIPFNEAGYCTIESLDPVYVSGSDKGGVEMLKMAPCPTLEELIGELGYQFGDLSRVPSECGVKFIAYANQSEVPRLHPGRAHPPAYGKTPSEAVAKLWLSLQGKQA